jgi:hypothetical protein
VVGLAGQLRSHADVQRHAGRRVHRAAGTAQPGHQPPRLVGRDDDGVGGQPVAVGQAHRGDPRAGRLELGHTRAVPEGDPGVGGGGGERVGDRRDAAHGVPDPGTDVELGDDGVGRDRPERRDPGVQRLEAEQPAQAVVGEVPLDVPGQPAEPAAAGEGDQLGAEQVQG